MRRMPAALVLALTACAQAPTAAPPPGESAAPLVGSAISAGTPVVPAGYGARLMAEKVADPRAIVFDGAGTPYVLEGSAARMSRVAGDGSLDPVAQGGGNGPWTGAAWHNDRLYVAEAGGPLGGRLLRVDPGGGLVPAVANLPAGGTLGPLVAGGDGRLYLGVAATPAVGKPIPCQDIRLRRGGRVEGEVPCTGAVLRIDPEHGDVEVYAWGFADPTGLAFAPDGRLLVSDDVRRPSAPVPQMASADLLWEAVPGVWYGWPDFSGQLAMAEPQLADYPNPPPAPLATLDGEGGAVAVSRSPDFGGIGQAYVALAPSQTRVPGQAHTGRISFTNRANGETVSFAANLERPSALAFSPDGQSLWVGDAGNGRLWRITPMGTPQVAR